MQCAPRRTQVVDSDFNVLAELDDDIRHCWEPRCGGCNDCLLSQAIHYGLFVEDYRWWRQYVKQARVAATALACVLWVLVLLCVFVLTR